MKATQRTLLALGAAILVFGLGACSDDDNTVTPTTTSNYYPVVTGNYWVYQKQTLDSSGAAQSEGTITDSTVVGSTTTKEGETAYETTTYTDSSGMKSTSTGYTYNKDSKLYEYKSRSEYFPSIIRQTVGVKNSWVLSADFNSNSSWKLLDTTVQNIKFVFSGTPVTVGGNVKVTAKNTGIKSITYMGKSTSAQEITSSSLFTLTASGLPVTPFTITKHDYYVENIGLVESKTDSQTIPVPVFGNFTFEGEIKTLIRTNTK